MSRVQLALNVNNIDEAVDFYTKLFGAGPAKRRAGYANFALSEPPLKLVLLENPGQGGTLNHLGVEVPDAGTVDAEQTRLAAAGLASTGLASTGLASTGLASTGLASTGLASTGLASTGERATTCCYATQDKFWVQGAPNGESWEIYTVLADSPTFWGPDAEAEARWGPAGTGETAACCGGTPEPAGAGDHVTSCC